MDAKSKARFAISIGDAAPQKSSAVCPHCGAENPAGSKFCGSCGNSLNDGAATAPVEKAADATSMLVCPHCGVENVQGSKFCKKCGTSLIQGNASDEATAISANSQDRRSQDRDGEADAGSRTAAFVKIDDAAHQESTGSNSSAADAEDRRVSAFEPTSQPTDTDSSSKGKASTFVPAVPVEESSNELVFAQGLPDWDIVPPQVVVRRKGGRVA